MHPTNPAIFENGRGVYNSGTGVLSRATQYETSDAGAKVDFAVAPVVAVAPLKTDFDEIAAALPASILTTRGDMIRRGASAPERFAKGTEHQVLLAGADDPAWGALNLAQAAAITGTLPAGNLPAATTSAIGAVEKALAAEVYAAAADKYLAADHIETASAAVVLTHGAPTALDWDAGVYRTWTITASVTLSNPTNGQPGTWRTIRVEGNNTTDRAITFGNQYLNVLPVLTDVDSTRPYLIAIYCHTASEFYAFAHKLRDI